MPMGVLVYSTRRLSIDTDPVMEVKIASRPVVRNKFFSNQDLKYIFILNYLLTLL
jgi:hypothetical protein